MTRLREALDDYLAIRRQLGFKLENDGRLLAQFVAFVEQAGQRTVTTQLAVAWAREPAGVKPHRWRQRLGMVRRFAFYLATVIPETEIPPADLLPARQQRLAPYIYSLGEIDALMSASDGLSPPVRAITVRTVIGLLAATGMRIGEVLALDDTTVDLDAGVITATGKWGKQREIPLHPTTVTALHEYQHDSRSLATHTADWRAVHHSPRKPADQGRVPEGIPGAADPRRARGCRRARPASSA